jgi:hypothetical protein
MSVIVPQYPYAIPDDVERMPPTNQPPTAKVFDLTEVVEDSFFTSTLKAISDLLSDFDITIEE